MGLPLCLAYRAWPVWWGALLHGWCAGGIAAVGLTCALRCWPPGSGWRRLGAAAALMGVVVLLALPLMGLYVPHLTSGDAPRVVMLSERRDLAITLRDGCVLDARFYRPRSGALQGVVVFTHGVGGWKEAWRHHLGLFLEADWAVLAYDLRGHGRSSPGAVTYGWREVDDLAEVWEVARGLAPQRPLASYGVSMGTGIAVLAAGRLADCRALILESPFADYGAMAERRLPWPVRAPAMAVARLGVGMDVAALRPLAVRPPADMRCLFGWIAEDRVVPADQSAALAAALGAQTLVQEHGRHLDLIEHEPWRELVRRTLSGIRP
jgi:pimeloyl-ACP methyl ester carboxylesterase